VRAKTLGACIRNTPTHGCKDPSARASNNSSVRGCKNPRRESTYTTTDGTSRCSCEPAGRSSPGEKPETKTSIGTARTPGARANHSPHQSKPRPHRTCPKKSKPDERPRNDERERAKYAESLVLSKCSSTSNSAKNSKTAPAVEQEVPLHAGIKQAAVNKAQIQEQPVRRRAGFPTHGGMHRSQAAGST
jgi:hypothetical protein